MWLRRLLWHVSVVATFAAGPAAAEVRFETEPHVLALEHRQQIVLFSDEGTGGAMATRRSDGSFDVLVPDAALAHALHDRDFIGPPVGEGGAGTVVSLDRTKEGDVRIHIRPAGDVARVVPHAVGGPHRLLIDLLPAGADAAAGPRRPAGPAARSARTPPAGDARVAASAPRGNAPDATRGSDGDVPDGGRTAPEDETSETVTARALPDRKTDTAPLARATSGEATAAAVVDTSPREPAAFASTPPGERTAAAEVRAPPAVSSTATETGTPRAKPGASPEGPETSARGPTAERAISPAVLADRRATRMAPSLEGAGHASCIMGAAPSPEEALCRAPDAAPSPSATRARDRRPGRDFEGLAATETGSIEASAVWTASFSADGSDDLAPGCRFRRAHGFAFCAPTPGHPGYGGDPYVEGVAYRIAAGATWLAPIEPGEDSPAAVYLEADRQFLVDSREGYLLESVRAYRRAARNQPEFPDAERAYMNVALIYGAIGFDVELAIEASNPSNPARDFAQAVLGDLRRRQGRFGEAAALYERARHGRPLSACWAARGLAALAVEEGRVERAREGLEALRELCPTEVLLDFETERLRASVEVAGGEPDKALATLAIASKRASLRQRGEVARERALVAETGGRTNEARAIWGELERGEYGEEFVLEAGIALARLGGSTDEIRQSLERADALPVGTRERARKELFDGVSQAARSSGDDLTPLSLVLSDGLEPEMLNVRSRIGMAAAYRKVGLLEGAVEVLDGIEAAQSGGLPEEYWEERAAVALGLGDLSATEVALGRWRISRGGNPSAGELSTRARLLARRGDAPQDIERLLSRLDGLDAALADETRWRVAAIQADGNPLAALASLGGEEALRRIPDVAEEQVTETLWTLGRSAEGSGETELALAAYRSLAAHLPATSRGADAAYRAGRILEERDAYADARREYRRAETHPDELDRRFAEATSAFHELVEPWTRRLEEE